MVFNTNITIALKNYLNKYNVKTVSLFELEYVCKGFDYLRVKIKKKEIIFEIQCPLCDQKHFYKYIISDLMKKDMLIGGCEVLNVPLFLVGKEDKIMEKVNKYEHINSEINKMICTLR
ncbi:hypothetical protein ACFIJ5_15720 [Haloimpatiens sp. FM7330]|uniref:hypothetical protein n=1 Tax=Haloimpatiens sp. FM7330 TaxID=3298610 RepID=UPI00364135E6